MGWRSFLETLSVFRCPSLTTIHSDWESPFWRCQRSLGKWLLVRSPDSPPLNCILKILLKRWKEMQNCNNFKARYTYQWVRTRAALSCSVVSDSATPWTVARQPRLSMGFSRQGCSSGLPCLPAGGLPRPGIEPTSAVAPALRADSSLLSHWRSPMYKTGSNILAFHKLSLSIRTERIFIHQRMTSPQTSWSCFFERVRRFCSIV